MSFQERSAWAMLLVLIISGYLMANTVITESLAISRVIEPHLGLVINYVIIVTVLSVTSHILLAVTSPKTAERNSDEREQLFSQQAMRISSFVMSFAVVTGLLNYLYYKSGALLFYTVFAGLVIAEITQNIIVIIRHRRGY